MSRHQEQRLTYDFTNPEITTITEDNKSSFSMSGHVCYRTTNTAIASAASVSWIQKDLL